LKLRKLSITIVRNDTDMFTDLRNS